MLIQVYKTKEGKEIHHIANTVQSDGTFTICTKAIDCCDEYDGYHFEREYSSTIKDCTCKECKNILREYKRLK